MATFKDVWFFSGAEGGELDEWTGSTGTVSIETSPVRTGNYAVRANPTTTAVGYVTYTINSYPENAGTATFYFRYATKPAANNEPFFAIGNAELRLSSTGIITLYTGTTLLDTGLTVLAADTWYRFDVTGDDVQDDITVRLNGQQEVSSNAATFVLGDIRLGKANNRNGQTVDFFYDDFVFGFGTVANNPQVTRLTPSGNGNYTAWAGDYNDVNEVPPNDGTTFISSSTLNQQESFTITPNTVLDDRKILAVQVRAVGALLTSQQDFALFVRSAGTDSALTSGTWKSATYTWSLTTDVENATYEFDPATSAPWLPAAVKAVEIGIKNTDTDGAGQRVTALYGMVLSVSDRRILKLLGT